MPIGELKAKVVLYSFLDRAQLNLGSHFPRAVKYQCSDRAMNCARLREVGSGAAAMDEGREGRKRVIGIMAAILAARKLAQYDGGARVPATISAIADSIRWAEQIMDEIDRRYPVKPTPQQERRVT